MAIVTVYPRHSKKCPKYKQKGSGQYKRCGCPLWLRWGKSEKESAKTRSWEIATKKARKLEQELDLKALGIEPPKPQNHTEIEEAAKLYLADMEQREIKDISKVRRMLYRLREYANDKNAFLLKDVTSRLLTEWRNTWTFKKNSDSPAVHWSIVKTFFRWAFQTDLIPADPSAKLKSLPSGRKQVLPLTQEEMDRLLDAIPACGFSDETAFRVRTFILLQRWSGLACMDAATLARNLLKPDDNLARVRRNKTGVEISVPLPPAVADMLRALRNDHPDYFFWNPKRMGKKSLVADYIKLIRKVFDQAGISHGQQEMLTHRFRHTFAVESLIAGMKIEKVAKLLGHKTIRTTEKYYSAWVNERQQMLEAEVKEAWTKMKLPAPFHPMPQAIQ